MKKDVERGAAWFSQGTIACAVAHNWENLEAVADPAVLQEASKTGLVLMMMVLSGQKVLGKRSEVEA